jgi:hypothetical protein
MIINAQYAVGRVVPQEAPKGRVLAHQIEHTARTPNGVRSFRWWSGRRARRRRTSSHASADGPACRT